MRAVAEPRVAELPAEFHGPVGLTGLWPMLALAAVVVVVAFYLAVWAATRAEPRSVRGSGGDRVAAGYLARIEQTRVQVHDGTITPREGHQDLSVLVRSYVEETSALPATRMSLADFRISAPHLAATIEMLYPPEFAPETPEAEVADFDRAALAAARLIEPRGQRAPAGDGAPT